MNILNKEEKCVFQGAAYKKQLTKRPYLYCRSEQDGDTTRDLLTALTLQTPLVSASARPQEGTT